ncbi:hypothetical protein KKH46_01470 [Patescibacteria group bacterium]|nr:hypothetical protein [Patescibacteria group bacterium]
MSVDLNPHHYTNMNLVFTQQILGSSLTFFAQGGRGKEKNCKPAEKIAVESEGEAEGGCGGNSAMPEPKRSPAALLVQSRTQQKSFLFLLEEKIGRAQNKKCEENFFAGWRALASGGGANQLPFRSKKVRAKCRISPPIETSSFERIAPRGREAAALRKMIRRFAANWLAGQKSKTADLFVSYLKTI